MTPPPLPVELIQHILKLSMEESDQHNRTSNLLSFSFVARVWQQVAQPLLLERIALNGNDMTIRRLRMLKRLLVQGKGRNVQILAISLEQVPQKKARSAATRLVMEVVELCANLDELSLFGMKNLDWNHLLPRLSKLRVMHLSRSTTLSPATTATTPPTSSLQFLSLTDCQHWSPVSLILPNLRGLSVTGDQHVRGTQTSPYSSQPLLTTYHDQLELLRFDSKWYSSRVPLMTFQNLKAVEAIGYSTILYVPRFLPYIHTLNLMNMTAASVLDLIDILKDDKHHLTKLRYRPSTLGVEGETNIALAEVCEAKDISLSFGQHGGAEAFWRECGIEVVTMSSRIGMI